MIIPFEESYAGEITEIWLKTTISAHPFISEDYWKQNSELVKTKYLFNSETYIYEGGDGSFRGFISILPADQDHKPKDPDAKNAMIGALFVLPEYQGQGVGSALINHCKDRYDELYLHVYSQNEDALYFYESQGFVSKLEQRNKDTNHTECLMVWSDDNDWCNLLLGMQC